MFKKLSRAELKRAHLARTELIKNCKWSGTADYYMASNTKIVAGGNTACHAGLAEYGRNKAPGLFAVVSAFMVNYGGAYGAGSYKDNTKEEIHMFVHWLLNESPYSSAFVSKSANYAIKQKCVISNGYAPSNLMVGGLVASRRLWEYSYVVRVFCELAKRGVNKDLAFLLAHLPSVQTKPKDNSELTWTNPLSGHTSLDMYKMSLEACRNFIEHKIQDPNPPYIEQNKFNYYDSMYEEGGRLGLGIGKPTLYDFVSKNFPYEECLGQEKKAPRLNPFVAAVKKDNPKAVTFKAAMDVMAKWANEVIMEKINAA